MMAAHSLLPVGAAATESEARVFISEAGAIRTRTAYYRRAALALCLCHLVPRRLAAVGLLPSLLVPAAVVLVSHSRLIAASMVST